MSLDMDFCHLPEICLKNIWQILDTATKKGLDAAKTTSKKIISKTASAMIAYKIAEKIVKPKPIPD